MERHVMLHLVRGQADLQFFVCGMAESYVDVPGGLPFPEHNYVEVFPLGVFLEVGVLDRRPVVFGVHSYPGEELTATMGANANRPWIHKYALITAAVSAARFAPDALKKGRTPYEGLIEDVKMAQTRVLATRYRPRVDDETLEKVAEVMRTMSDRGVKARVRALGFNERSATRVMDYVEAVGMLDPERPISSCSRWTDPPPDGDRDDKDR
jgi:hypothetical protein